MHRKCGFRVAEFVFEVILTIILTNNGLQGGGVQRWENFKVVQHCSKLIDSTVFAVAEFVFEVILTMSPVNNEFTGGSDVGTSELFNI